ncbi:MAG: methionine synthase [Muribaculaceae bacterium]|nr:methionine synthase [Muribaculaceae bacterium]
MTPHRLPPLSDRSRALIAAMQSEILILDGAMGTMIQSWNLIEADFHKPGVTPDSGSRVLEGCNDILCITRPEVIESIHKQYIEAGARIIETNSFNSNAISLADYGMSHMARRIALEAAATARRAAEAAPEPVWVAGSIGPTGKSLSMASALGDDSVTFDSLTEAYTEQIQGLMEGGADMLLIETVFDALNAKAAIFAAYRVMRECGQEIPIAISVTLTESGRTLSGQSVEAFINTISHARPLWIGFNCGFGAEQMVPFIERIQHYPYAIGAYPNAGLPNALGQYDQTPELMNALLKPLMQRGMLNVVGGCCGTTPEHIRALSDTARGLKPRIVPGADSHVLHLAGLDTLDIISGHEFIKVGERCNVAGSRKFLRLIKEGDMEQALAIAGAQIRAGADIIDLNMDDAMLPAAHEMCRFIDRIGTEPSIASKPLMIDSSDWDVITQALKHVQGRPVVNSISLKEGEEAFLNKASHIREMGAAVIVMAFDETGQADTMARRIEICQRAYRLLTEKAGYNPADIIFDPNILTVATGMAEHRTYALDFILATEWIKEHLTGARVSGGISNLSFAFRGNNKVREAMHALFLTHARKAGMDMAIVNPSALLSPTDIEPELAEAINDVLLNRTDDATDTLTAIAGRIKAEELAAKTATAPDKEPPAQKSGQGQSAMEHLMQMVIRGATEGIDTAVDAAVGQVGSAMAVINDALMEGMNRIGQMFSRGEMFLPQVVKSAQTMKIAVARMTPLIERESVTAVDVSKASSPTVVLATVKGDVHDIGKNIVSVILQCNGFKVLDLGVMAESEKIVRTAIEHGAAAIGLSGLITPSLSEMCNVAALMEAKGLKIPLAVGGAAASREHTAVRISTTYSGPVIYTHEAASLPSALRKLTHPDTALTASEELRAEQDSIRSRYAESAPLLTLEAATARKPAIDFSLKPAPPVQPGTHDGFFTVSELRDGINVRAFFKAWGFDGSLATVTDIEGCDHCRAQWLAALPQERRLKGSRAMQLWKEAGRMLDRMSRIKDVGVTYRVALCCARSEGNDIIYSHPDIPTEEYRLPTLRRQTDDGGRCPALADFIDPSGNDSIGVFAVTISQAMRTFIDALPADDDMYSRMLAEALAHRLVEAGAERMHYEVRTRLWGFSPDEPDSPRRLLRAEYQGIRPAIGYPSLPDQSLVFTADSILHYSDLGITLTENGAMAPSATVSGFIFGHPSARYFIVGKIDDRQRADYIRRRGLGAEAAKFL